MGSRSIAQIAPTSATIALNAYIYGYGGHSLVTPHVAVKQLWWTDERIDAKVTRAFITSKLRGQEREFLHRPLGFGEGLTDDTYMDWIIDRAKRLFLILAEVGVPDQIFGCIDDSWSDDDLPISLTDVASLELTLEKDDSLNRRFYELQFTFLLRELTPGAHIDYGPNEHIPMEYANSVPPAVTLQSWDRIHLPQKPRSVYMRRKFSLSDKDAGSHARDSFMRDVKRAKALAHRHICPLWASYTSESKAYVLFDMVGEHTLQTFIDHRTPVQWMRVSAHERPRQLYEWMHCLADALAFLHHRGYAHAAIRPSNIVINEDNEIAFADVGSLRTFQHGKKANKTEAYDYAAPESLVSMDFSSSPPIAALGPLAKLRKGSFSTSSGESSSSGASNSGASRSGSFSTAPTSPLAGLRGGAVGGTQLPKHSSRVSNFSRHLSVSPPNQSRPISPSFPLLHKSTTSSSMSMYDTLPELPEVPAEQSDIFSLGCIFLDITTFMLKGKTTDFVKFRSTRTANPPSSSPNLAVPSKATSGKKMDASFHANPERLEMWMTTLETEARKPVSGHSTSRRLRPGGSTSSSTATSPLLAAAPLLIALIRDMLHSEAVLRPSARAVRDRLREILTEHTPVSAENLCCAGSGWEDVLSATAPVSETRNSTQEIGSIDEQVAKRNIKRQAMYMHPPHALQVEDGLYGEARSPPNQYENQHSPREDNNPTSPIMNRSRFSLAVRPATAPSQHTPSPPVPIFEDGTGSFFMWDDLPAPGPPPSNPIPSTPSSPTAFSQTQPLEREDEAQDEQRSVGPASVRPMSRGREEGQQRTHPTPNHHHESGASRFSASLRKAFSRAL